MAHLNQTVRKYHRYLGFFLAGIMTLYASSGVLLIFRGTDALKIEVNSQEQLATNLSGAEVIAALKLRKTTVVSESPTEVVLSNGRYSPETGQASITNKKYLPVVDEIVHMHKATDKSPLFWLNILFGSGLLFFSISSFFLFPPSAPALRTGLKVAAGGFVFAVAVVAFG